MVFIQQVSFYLNKLIWHQIHKDNPFEALRAAVRHKPHHIWQTYIILQNI